MFEFEKKINELKEIKAEMRKKDIKNIWEYYEPNPPASESEIARVRNKGLMLDEEIIEFWKNNNGWNCFYQMVDLFGTTDMFSERMNYANTILKIEIENQNEFNGGQLLPIAISRDDMDIFTYVKDGNCRGKVIWYAGGEIERFDSFIDFFSCMIEYCRADLYDLCNA
mgnify:CR=1 FL=1